MVVGQGYVQVNANQAETGGNGSDFEYFPCDGDAHTLSLFLTPGPWQLGQALVRAYACGWVCGEEVVKYVHIN
jgi:hypothetical protein